MDNVQKDLLYEIISKYLTIKPVKIDNKFNPGRMAGGIKHKAIISNIAEHHKAGLHELFHFYKKFSFYYFTHNQPLYHIFELNRL